jgi:hypothetical protein
VAGRSSSRSAARGASLAAALAAAPASASEPRGAAVAPAAAALADLPAACRERVARELHRGEAEADAACDVARGLAARRQLLAGRRPSFGVVERTREGVGRVSLLLSEARGCHRWPLRLPGRAALGLYEVKGAGCWVRRYSGELALAGVSADGERTPRVFVARVDGDGRVAIDLAQIDASLRRGGLPGLDGYVRLELGVGGWAGSVDLVAARRQFADLHAAAVQRGRGVPALLPVRHPDHPGADRVRGLALEATLRRQEVDFQAVQRGELPPHRFLERYAWSPYRQLVAATPAE